MRPALFVLLLLSVSFASAQDAKKQKKKQRPAASGVEQLAPSLSDRIFKEADRNRNGFLNRGEFAKASGMLKAAIAGLAQQGALGRGGRGGERGGNEKRKQPRGDAARGAAGPASPDLDGNKKITPEEFAAYTAAMLQNADSSFARLRERLESARKNGRKKANNRPRPGGKKKKR